jgi:hypothetical protein
MRRRFEIFILLGLLVVLIAVILVSRNHVPGLAGVLADNGQFQPLDIQEPQLRLDLIAKLQKLEYSGSHRNIFDATSPPTLPLAGQRERGRNSARSGPQLPPPPPPLQVPAQFFGYASTPGSSKRVAFFLSGEDVVVVAEGDTFLNRFRLVRIGNDSADVEEIATGRHANVALEQLPQGQAQEPNQ